MNLFRSVFADDEPSKSNLEPSSSQNPEQEDSSQPDPDHPPTESSPPSTSPSSISGVSGVGGWSIGGLVKTFATRSESVIETYRRDLQEFRSGLKKETQSLREVANRAVKELPPEINASKAIDSIGSTLWKSTAEIIAQGKESFLADDVDLRNSSGSNKELEISGGGRYNRFDSQLRAIQCDVHTYVEEPESGGDGEYEKWRSGFDLGEKGEEMEDLMRENGGAVGEIYNKVVPDLLDHETFWCRYYYQINKLVQADSARAKLVATSRDDEEELSWEIDDEEVVVEEVSKKLDNVAAKSDSSGIKDDSRIEKYAEGKDQIVVKEEKEEGVTHSPGDGDVKQVDAVQAVDDEKSACTEKSASESKKDESTTKKVDIMQPAYDEKVAGKEAVLENASVEKKDESTEKKVVSDAKAPAGQTSVAPKQLSSQQEEEELGWDEIEDLGSDDEDSKKVAPSRSSDREEIRKRLSVVDDDDENLSWDIEDDD